jgi:hypothetical protein
MLIYFIHEHVAFKKNSSNGIKIDIFMSASRWKINWYDKKKLEFSVDHIHYSLLFWQNNLKKIAKFNYVITLWCVICITFINTAHTLALHRRFNRKMTLLISKPFLF